MSQIELLIGFQDNDMILEIPNVRDALVNPDNDPNGTFLNSATVELENMRDPDGNQVGVPAVFPLALVFVALSNGIYRATIPDNWPLLAGLCYTMIVTVDAGPGLRGEWTLIAEYKLREE